MSIPRRKLPISAHSKRLARAAENLTALLPGETVLQYGAQCTVKSDALVGSALLFQHGEEIQTVLQKLLVPLGFAVMNKFNLGLLSRYVTLLICLFLGSCLQLGCQWSQVVATWGSIIFEVLAARQMQHIAQSVNLEVDLEADLLFDGDTNLDLGYTMATGASSSKMTETKQSTSGYKIEKGTDLGNFSLWAGQIFHKLIAQGQGVSLHSTNPSHMDVEVWTEMCIRACNEIYLHLSNNIQAQVMEYNTSHELWMYLNKLYLK